MVAVKHKMRSMYLTPSKARRRPAGSAAVSGQRHRSGGRLAMAFDALETFPALAYSRDRLLSVMADANPATDDIVAAVESDVALMIAVLRLANDEGTAHQRVDTVVLAVEMLGPQMIQTLANRARTFDFFERAGTWGSAPERLRLHSLATQQAADRIASMVGAENRNRLAVTSLLHDIGKLVLLGAYPGYPSQVHNGARMPEERIHHERRELGVDHALMGGVLIRRWRLPATLAIAIELHHDPEAGGEAAIIRLADMLAHYEQGTRVSPRQLLDSARVVGLEPEQLRCVMCEQRPSTQRQRHDDPCPLSDRELVMLRRLAKRGVYKQIASELGISASTVRSHLHNVYCKLGAANRAQAVLIANEHGWL